MNLYTFILVKIIVVTMNRGIEISLELQKNILKFGYGINYKYEGMLAHSFDRFYIVTKFMLQSMGDIKFSKLNFDHTCIYMNKEYAPNTDSRKYLTELKTYCNKIKPFVSHYNKLIKSYNITVHNILENEIKPLLPQISRQKHGIITTLVSGFIGLAYEGISSFLQQKCENALQIAVNAMTNQANIQHNKLMKLDNTLLMYGIYNAKTLEKLINTLHEMHNVTSSHENYLQGNTNPTLFRLLYMDALGIIISIVQMIEKFLICKKHTHFSPYKNFFLNQIVNIFMFTSSIISIIAITLVIYLFCKHKHIRTIVASLILHKAKEVEAKINY